MQYPLVMREGSNEPIERILGVAERTILVKDCFTILQGFNKLEMVMIGLLVSDAHLQYDRYDGSNEFGELLLEHRGQIDEQHQIAIAHMRLQVGLCGGGLDEVGQNRTQPLDSHPAQNLGETLRCSRSVH